MAVKVMLAPSLVKPAPKSVAPEEAAARAAPRPKRRRSSVFDADGNEVFITLLCLKCKKMRPLSFFGLRRMADGTIRNQPWCRSCRSGNAETSPRSRKAAVEAAPELEPAVEVATPTALDVGSLAAQVTAALHGGRR